MKTLVIDTCTNRIIVALADNSTIFSFCNEIIENQMSNIIMEKVEKCFEEADMRPSDVERILVAVGPGSYTGIRIGVTIAKTYAWALKREIIPISSLEVMISGYDDKKLLVPYIDARRNSCFGAIYDNKLNQVLKDQYISMDDLKNKLSGKDYIFVSDNDLVESKEPKIDIIKLINKHSNDACVNPHSLNPVYLKKTEAEENLK
jgi:tRNA threonylcarbamoyl adenosine modification protein YeaZ